MHAQCTAWRRHDQTNTAGRHRGISLDDARAARLLFSERGMGRSFQRTKTTRSCGGFIRFADDLYRGSRRCNRQSVTTQTEVVMQATKSTHLRTVVASI